MYGLKTVLIELTCMCIPFCFLALIRIMVMKTVMIKMRTTPAAVLIAVIIMLFDSGGNWVVPLMKEDFLKAVIQIICTLQVYRNTFSYSFDSWYGWMRRYSWIGRPINRSIWVDCKIYIVYTSLEWQMKQYWHTCALVEENKPHFLQHWWAEYSIDCTQELSEMCSPNRRKRTSAIWK